MELSTAGGRLVDRDETMPVFSACSLPCYTGIVQTIAEYAWEAAGPWETTWQSRPSGGAEFSTGSFKPMENSKFMESLANRRL